MWSDNVNENLNKYLTELNGQCGLQDNQNQFKNVPLYGQCAQS